MGLLDARDVTVRFGGLAALSEASVSVESGEIAGLIGPNGAGKTTLFDVITGLRAPQAGRVSLDGEDITRVGVHGRARRGIARTFQKLEVFGELSVFDNVLVATEMRRRWNKTGVRPREEALALLDQVGLSEVAGLSVAGLPTGTARLVELARALAIKPRVLLLDEPSSGLNDSETANLAALLGALTADGLAVLLVEHDMSFVMGTCTRIMVLNFGEVIAKGTPEQVRTDQAVRAAYLGAPVES